MKISSVVIIYNPNSSGSSAADAKHFSTKLLEAGISAKAVPTTHAGHGKQLAREYAERKNPPMIISASGDGGYNEVINGVLSSKNPEAVTGVLPSGNANDHYHFVHHGDTVARIARGDVEQIDVLKLTRGKTTRFAHSYIGLGLTPQIGEALTEQRPSKLEEIGVVLRGLLKVVPVKVRYKGRSRRYHHLVFHNIGRMSKVLKVQGNASIHDGKFEIIALRKKSLPYLFSMLFRHASTGIEADARTDKIEFVIERGTKIQLDGEVINVRKGDTVRVTSERKLLRTIV